MATDNIDKIVIGLTSALLALILKTIFDNFKKRTELSKLKQVLVTDLVHQITTAGLFAVETDKLRKIYNKGLSSLKKNQPYDFYSELQSTRFKEVFFSDEIFKTINKIDLLDILRKDSRSFGEVHNIYHIVLKLKDCNSKYYEDLYDEHLIAYLDGIDKDDLSKNIDALRKALNYITIKLQADINNAESITMLTYEYLVNLIGKRRLRKEFGIEMNK